MQVRPDGGHCRGQSVCSSSVSREDSDLYEFGTYRLDVRRRVFTRDEQVVPLAPKTFALLLLLVRTPGRAFSKQELISALWPDTFVEEANLSFQISILRKALGESGSQWIETVPKHGYRFAGEVKSVAPTETVQTVATASQPEPRVLRTRNMWLAATALATVLIVAAYMTRGSRSATTNDLHATAAPPDRVRRSRNWAEPVARWQSGRLRVERAVPRQFRHLREGRWTGRTNSPDDIPGS